MVGCVSAKVAKLPLAEPSAAEVLAELRAFREEWREAQMRDAAGISGPVAAELVRAIFGVKGRDRFAVWELVDLAMDPALQHARLLAAIKAAVGSLRAIRIGKALHRLVGEEFDGLVLVRVGEDRGSALWAVRELRA